MWVRSLGQEDPLEEEMATHSSILAWRIPCTEEPGGLWSMGCTTDGDSQVAKWKRIHLLVLIPGSERFPGEGHGNPLQYSCLENPMDRGAWWAAVHRVSQSRT